MDYARYDLIKLEHQHGPNSWHRMDEVDNPASHDSEREWGRHRLYKCSTCDEQIRVEVPETEGRTRP